MSTSRPSQPLEAALALQEPFLQRLARAIVQDENIADDLVQDTVAAALTHVRSKASGGRRMRLESLPPEGLRGWLSTVLRNTRIDRVRASRRSQAVDPETMGTLPSRVDSPDGIAQRLERQQLLHGALMSLPDAQRTVLVLRYQDDMSVREIAEATESPVPTVKSRLHRGLSLLKDELQRRSGGEPTDGPSWLSAILPLAQADHAAPLGVAASSTSSLLTLAMWKTIVLAVAAVFLVGVAVMATRGRSPALEAGGTGPRVASAAAEPDVSKGSDESGGGPEVARQVVAGAVLEPGQNAGAGPRPAWTGSVVSVSSRKPVPALVQVGASTSTRASMIDGKFLIEPTAASEGTLRLKHPMFEPLEIPLPAWVPPARRAEGRDALSVPLAHQDLGVIELTPKGEATVRAVDVQGRPIAGASCSLHRSLDQIMQGHGPGPGAFDQPFPVGETDVDGRCKVRLAFDATVSVLGPDGRMGAGRVSAGETAVVRLDGLARTVTFVDRATGDPVAGRAFPMGWQQGAAEASLFLRTDGNGEAALPVGAGRLTLCKGEPRLLIDGMRAGSRTIDARKPGSFQISEILQLEETQVTVLVSNHEVGIRLVNKATGEPVDGTAYCNLRYLEDRHGWLGPAADTPYSVVGGDITVHTWFADAREEETERWIAIPGYRIHTIAGGLELKGTTLALEPGEARRLRFVDGRGRPRELSFFLDLGPGISVRSRTGVDGISEAYPWDPGTAWKLRVAGVGAVKDGLTIAADTLAANEIVALNIDKESSGIRFVGVPADSPPLFAGNTHGATAAVSARPGEFEALGLSPGSYAVGPQSWMTQLAGRGRQVSGLSTGHSDADFEAVFLVHVAAGETAEVPWDPRWASAAPLTGRVLALGLEGSDLAVLPVYGLTGTSIYFGPSTPWVYCDNQGQFRTRPGEPQPVALLFARFGYDSFGRKPIVLDSQYIRADGEYSIGLTSFELVATNAEEWSNADAESHPSPMLFVLTDDQQLDAPMQFLDGVGPRIWDPAGPVHVTGLPAHVHQVMVRNVRDREGTIVPITPGGHSRIELVVPLPEPKAKREAPPMLIQGR